MANQLTINIGTVPNDGTGDPLRTAFNEVNLNFANVWATGLMNSNVQFSNTRITTSLTNANLILAPNGTGKVASNVDIVPNTHQAFDLGSTTRRWNTVYSQFVDVSGNIQGNYILGNGYFLTGLSGAVSSYGNANVVNLLQNFGSNSIVTTGNISASYVNLANNITAQNDVIAKRGTFSGDPVTGDASLYVGSPTFTNLGTDVMAQFTGNVPAYAQLNLQNFGNSVTASGDYIITADNGTDTTRFLDLGLAGSNWDGSQDNSLGNLIQPNWGYLYVQDGGLVIGTRIGNTANVVTINTNGNVTMPNNLSVTGIVNTGVFTASTIPSAATAGAGARAFVTDSDAVTFGALYTGGAANSTPVWSNGSAWYVG